MTETVATIRVRETLTFLEVMLHGLTLTAYFLKAFATPIISLVMGAHDVIREEESLAPEYLQNGQKQNFVQCFSGRLPRMLMDSQCRLPGACSSPSRLEGVMMSWDVVTSR